MAHSGEPSDHAVGLEKIIASHYGEIYKYCCRKTRDPAQAQDITQEVFLRFMYAAEK